MDIFEQVCPRCKTTNYRNPSLKLLVNVCGHALCESCVDLLFVRGSGNCPDCKIPLRRNNFRIQLFEDNYIEKEIDIRRRVLKDFNKREEDFTSLRDYNDYLEEVETIIFNLANEIELESTKKKIDQYKKENRDNIMKNKTKMRQEELELERMLEEEKYINEIRVEEIKKEEEEEKLKKLKNKEALIDELMFSDVDAKRIVADHKKNIEEEKPLPKAKPKRGGFTSGVRLGRLGEQQFLPVPKVAETPLYEYVPQDLVIDGPEIPSQEELSSRGYLNNIRAAELIETVAGYNEGVSCLRALQEAMVGMFFQHQEQMDVT